MSEKYSVKKYVWYSILVMRFIMIKCISKLFLLYLIIVLASVYMILAVNQQIHETVCLTTVHKNERIYWYISSFSHSTLRIKVGLLEGQHEYGQ